ncbi:MAG TPA: hypothetical protein VHR47_07080 [Bacillota bacterium]|nr:hypothetical protein [Bacillota bacterium]
MKIGFMKKALAIAMLAMVATAFAGVVGVTPASARGRLEINFGKQKQQKKDARRTLRRTAEVLQQAQELANDRRDDRDDRDRRDYRHDRHGRRGHGDRDNRGRRQHDGIRHRGLGRAFAFQQRAEDCYHNGDYERAINLSLHSRAIALRVIQRMHGWDDDENWRDDGDDFRHVDMDRNSMDDTERRYWDRRPSDDKLDVEVNGNDVNDDVAVNFHINLDF